MFTILNTIEFAVNAHAGQVRKYTGKPYVTHPIQVASTLESYYQMYFGKPAPTEMIQAAMLHDVLEDCPHINVDDILNEFGVDVLNLVVGLTDTSKKTGLPRKDRKILDAQRMTIQSIDVKTIKVFDIIVNTSDMANEDPEYAKQYIQEKIDFMPALKGINAGLYDELWMHLNSTLDLLNDGETDFT